MFMAKEQEQEREQRRRRITKTKTKTKRCLDRRRCGSIRPMLNHPTEWNGMLVVP